MLARQRRQQAGCGIAKEDNCESAQVRNESGLTQALLIPFHQAEELRLPGNRGGMKNKVKGGAEGNV
jgi:hypothetical protein